jgi:hypothetical protein
LFDHAVNIIGIFMKAIEGELIKYVEGNEKEAGEAYH